MTTADPTNLETENEPLGLFPSIPAPIPHNLPSLSADSPADGDWKEELWPSAPPDPPLAESDGIRQVNIGWLKPHAFSLKIYGEEDIDRDLVESIKAVGIQHPLKVTVDGVVISGHRRLKASKQTDLETVPVFVARPRYTSITVEEQILEANRTRIKDNEQRVREFIAYKVIETARAKARCGHRSDLVPNSAHSDTESEASISMSAGAALAREIGKARDIAAKKVGMAGSTAADGEKVVAALDRLWEAEDHQGYRQLREALLKSIRAALQLGLERGWIPKPTQKGRATKTDATAGHSDEEHGHNDDPADIGKPADDHGQRDKAHASVEAAEMAGPLALAEAPMTLPETGSVLLRDRQLPANDVVAEPPQTVPPSSNEDGLALPLSAFAPSEPAVPTVAHTPMVSLDESDDKFVSGLIPDAAATRATTTVSRSDFPGCDDPDIVPCSRSLVGQVAAMLNEQAVKFPDMAGRDLCRALGIANTKLQVAMKWV